MKLKKGWYTTTDFIKDLLLSFICICTFGAAFTTVCFFEMCPLSIAFSHDAWMMATIAISLCAASFVGAWILLEGFVK